MSTALSFVCRGRQSSCEKPVTYPLRRVEPLLHKYFKVFQINLDRMQQHRVNIQKVLYCYQLILIVICQYIDATFVLHLSSF